MSTLRRVAVVGRMQGRDFARRPAAVTLLVLLPLAFYLVQLSDDLDALVAGGIGVGWVAAAAGLFSSLASRRVEPRLILAGYRAADLLLGRLVFLYAVGAVMVVFFGTLMVVLSRPADPLALVLAIALTAVIAVPLGLAIAAVLPRELEGMLVLIGAIGIQMAVQPPGPFLPLYGPLRMMELAAGAEGALAPPLLHGVGAAVLLFGVGLIAWVLRMPATPPGARSSDAPTHSPTSQT